MGWELGRFFETPSPVFEMSPVTNSGPVGQNFATISKNIGEVKNFFEVIF
jgi:hypothetical protein